MARRAFRSRAEIREHQAEALRMLLGRVLPANRFYRAKAAAAHRGVETARWEEIGLDGFVRRFPYTTKAEVVADQLAHPPYGTNLTFPLERYTRCHQTSGTTGTPVRWLDTAESWDELVACWMEVLLAAGISASDRVFFAFSFGPFIGFWMAFAAAERLGAMCIPGGGQTSPSRLRMIMDHGVTVLCATPTYALHLAEVARMEGLDLGRSQVRKILVAGEPGGSIPETRARIESAWLGAQVFDHHGMTEVGPVTYECPATPGTLHVIESGYLAEVMDPVTGQAAAANERGELVLTTLKRVGSPLLRYRTGDLVEPVFGHGEESVSPCRCGRFELALRGGILGRVDDMIIVRGVNVFPSAVEAVIRRFAAIAEYQVSVSTAEGLTEMVVRIEPGAECDDLGGLVRRLQQEFQAAFALRIPVLPVAPGTLPRFELKAKRWIRLPDAAPVQGAATAAAIRSPRA